MKHVHVYKVDLTMISGNGDFPCPRCANLISPDDNTEKTYTIIEPKVNDQGLIEIVIRCNKCESFIHLTGFAFLQKTSTPDEAKPVHEGKEILHYITHV
jgi:hypothetical protein